MKGDPQRDTGDRRGARQLLRRFFVLERGVMRKRAKEPQVPPDRQDTLRHEIVALLADETLTANEISGRVRINEKEVLDHLEHVKIALHSALVVVPPL